MMLELHIIQNFAPSNLNRDDTGAPKDCEFGSVRRARISSQAFKRAIREQFKREGALAPNELAVRTKRIVNSVAERLVEKGRDEEQARRVATTAIDGMQTHVDQDGKTEYLLFVGRREISAIADICNRSFDTLLEAGSTATESDSRGQKPKETARIAKEIANELKGALDGGKAVDLALFGRMIADLPSRNIDAACQVAHAISTHRVAVQFDFYTAVDDLQERDAPEGAGAGMMGSIEFNSACFYRYINLDIEQLVNNLQGDRNLGRRATEAFLHACVKAVPTGKQNSMAAHNPPSMVLVVLQRSGHWPWSLANAFVSPVYPNHDGDLVHNSILALKDYRQRLTAVYGSGSPAKDSWDAVLLVDKDAHVDAAYRADTLDHLVKATVNQAFGQE